MTKPLGDEISRVAKDLPPELSNRPMVEAILINCDNVALRKACGGRCSRRAERAAQRLSSGERLTASRRHDGGMRRHRVGHWIDQCGMSGRCDLWMRDDVSICDTMLGIVAVRDLRLKHRARFADAVKANRLRPIRYGTFAGYLNHKKQLFLFTPDGFPEACGGFDPDGVARELHRRSLLLRGEPDRLRSMRVRAAVSSEPTISRPLAPPEQTQAR
jgi:hypothetical protein